MSDISLVVGLGNPGAQYEQTRHNVGFWLLDQLAMDYHTTFSMEKSLFGFLAKATIHGRRVYFLKPTTFMNLSGRSVIAVANFYKIPVASILVVHDELDIPCGQVKLKQGGGHAGHNGLRDIQKSLGPNFWRLRVGIDHPREKGMVQQVADYVLHRPSVEDLGEIEDALNRARIALPKLFSGDLDATHRCLSGKSIF